MTLRSVSLLALGAIVLGLAYDWLVGAAVGASVYLLTPGVWLKHSVGLRHGIPIWSFILNTLAMLLAAIPVAVLARVLFGRRGVVVALAAAMGVAAYATLQSIQALRSVPIAPPLPWQIVAVTSLDTLKLALLPAFLVLVTDRWMPELRGRGA